MISFSIPNSHKTVILGPYLHPTLIHCVSRHFRSQKTRVCRGGVGWGWGQQHFSTRKKEGRKSQESIFLLYTGPSGCLPPVSELEPSPPEEPVGKYNEVLKGLLSASEPRFEFSHPRYLDLSPMFVFLAFCLFDSVILYPIYPTASRARVELKGNQT